MDVEKIGYSGHKSLQDVVEDAFEQAGPGEGFEYTIGEIDEGKFKLVFEPAGSHDAVVIDGLGYELIFQRY